MKALKILTSPILVRLAAAAALVVVCAAPAMAQRGKWWQDDRFRKELGLTDEQSNRMEAIFQKAMPDLRDRMRSLVQAEEQFEQLMEHADDTTVMQHVSVVESRRAELNKTRTMMLLRMRRAMTADQWAKLTALADEGNRDRDPQNRQPTQQPR